MNTIRDLLVRDLDQPIEEVIKVGQQDEATVYNEIAEYVFTDRLKEQYREILQAIADGPGDPNENVGVWISGFFGSGKSSFAKNLGYILADRPLLGEAASDLFVKRLRQQGPVDPLVDRIGYLVDFVNARTPTRVIMFDVQVDRRGSESLAELMYSMLLRELDYATDYDVAEIEIELEGEGRLPEFVRICAELYAGEIKRPSEPIQVPETLSGVTPEQYGVWQMVRKGAQSIPRISAVLHQMAPDTYPTSEAGIQALRRNTAVTVRTLVDRTFSLAQRRLPGQAIVYIADEVGQYIARSGERIENLRVIAEHFGQESRNRVLNQRAAAPVWVMVTSQEKLDEVVAAIDDKRVELARLQDRFHHRVDMVPADIREVASKRVLGKKPDAEPLLRDLYQRTAGRLRTHTQLERTSRPSDIDENDFVQHYPYLPHFIDLSIDIVSGLRLEAGSPRHIGGSNRTIIKQAYEMMVSPRTRLAEAPIGELVTLDRIYDLVETNLSSEKQRDMSEIARRWPEDPWPLKTAKAIALLESVRDLPRTEANIAALLFTHVDEASPLTEVTRSVSALEGAQFIRQTEHGWKLQTAQEKSWTTERNSLVPNPRQHNEIVEDVLGAVLGDPTLSRYRFRNLRTFRVGVRWGGRTLTTGDSQVPLLLHVAESPDGLTGLCQEARDKSRREEHRNEIFWVMCLNDRIGDLVAEVYRSGAMVAKYEQLRAQNKLSREESSSLAGEKNLELRLTERLRGQISDALGAGRGFFRGVEKEGTALGNTLPEILHGLYDYAVPDLYEKLDMGARPLKGDEADQLLRAANLRGLPKVFYDPPAGLGLVKAEGSKTVINTQAPIAREVLDFMQHQHSYGNKVTGRVLEEHFGGLGYGWEREMLWLVTATLLRGGAIEVTYQGRRYRNHLDPGIRTPFTGTNAFRAASFAPRKAPDLMTLVNAVRRYEELTGEEIDVDEATIAQAFQSLVRSELESLLPVEATVKAHDIPVLPVLQEYRTWLETILNSASDDCVNMLAGEGASFQEMRDQVATIRRATDDEGLARLHRMRMVVQRIWPLLQAEGMDGALGSDAEVLQQRLERGEYYDRTPSVDKALTALEAAYRVLYSDRHAERRAAYTQAIDDIKGQPAWLALREEIQENLLRAFRQRSDHDLDLPAGSVTCTVCQASLAEMSSDLSAVDRLRSDTLLRIEQLTAPEEQIERVRVATVAGVGTTLATAEDVEQMLRQLQEHLLKLISSGIKVILE